MNNAILF